jgi:hypothetical protein
MILPDKVLEEVVSTYDYDMEGPGVSEENNPELPVFTYVQRVTRSKIHALPFPLSLSLQDP